MERVCSPLIWLVNNPEVIVSALFASGRIALRHTVRFVVDAEEGLLVEVASVIVGGREDVIFIHSRHETWRRG